MIGHLRYLGLLLPLFTFSSSAADKIPLSISPRRKPDRGVWASGELYRSRRVDPLFKADNDIRVSGLMSPLNLVPAPPGIRIRQVSG
jgi:hypothetical protein